MSFREEVLRPLWNQVRHTGNQIYHMISEHPVETMLQMERWYIKAPYIAYILNFPFTLWTDPLRCIIPLLMVYVSFVLYYNRSGTLPSLLTIVIYGASRNLLYAIFLTEFANRRALVGVTTDKLFSTIGLLMATDFLTFHLLGSLHLFILYYKLIRFSIVFLLLMPKSSVSSVMHLFFVIEMLETTLWQMWNKITKFKFEDLQRFWEELKADFNRQLVENEEGQAQIRAD